VPKLFEELTLARGDGRHPRILRSLGRADLLILDDWGMEPLDAPLAKSWRNDTAAVRPSSSLNSPWSAGTKSSAIPRTPTRSLIASSIMRAGSISPAAGPL
jgi:DNA replication protein DnaC